MAPLKNQGAVEEIPSGSFWASRWFPWRDPELSAVETAFLEGAPAPRGQDPGPRTLGFSGAGSLAGSSFMIPPSFDTALLENRCALLGTWCVPERCIWEVMAPNPQHTPRGGLNSVRISDPGRSRGI